jgi:hypothetical protein
MRKAIIFVGAIVAIAGMALAFKAPESTMQTNGSANPYVFNAPQANLTNVQTATVVIGGGTGTNFLSNYEGAVFLNLANVSGTSTITAFVDEGFVYSDGTTYWVQNKDTLVLNQAAGTYVVELGILSGRKYRVRISSSATGVTTYRLQFSAKPQ